ncbi:MAG TPA: hypothetical protein VFM94_07595, partial [Solirubrobacterales bacterium]|nr:hypothetical protein [Solirubrobacterales bacterium]
MSIRACAAIVALWALPSALAPTPDAAASPPRPADLRVAGRGDWRAVNSFVLSWVHPADQAPALVATRYRVRNPQGVSIREDLRHGVSGGVEVTVPKIPGSYGVELWFEDADGKQGPAATTSLRFDDVRPPAVALARTPEWIGRTALPLRVRIARLLGQAPPSGILGYAARIDRAPFGLPCQAADRCTDAETDLRGGIDDDELTVASLPEGTSYLHAVAVSGSGMKSATSAHATLRVDLTDPVTRLGGAPAGWTNRAVSLTATATDALSGMAAGDSEQPAFTAIRVDRGSPALSAGASTSTRVISEGEHLIEYYARDVAGNVDDGASSNGVANHPPRTTLVRIDRGPPTLSFGNSEDPRDPDLLRAWIGDALSGADPSRSWIGVRRVHSGDGFQRLPRAPSKSGELRARWDSDSYPVGNYEFQVTGYDEAG